MTLLYSLFIQTNEWQSWTWMIKNPCQFVIHVVLLWVRYCWKLYRFKNPLVTYPSVASDPEGSFFVSEQQKLGGRATKSSHDLSAPKGETGGVRDWLKSSAIVHNQYHLQQKQQQQQIHFRQIKTVLMCLFVFFFSFISDNNLSPHTLNERKHKVTSVKYSKCFKTQLWVQR